MPVGYVDFDISIVKRMLVISQAVHATMVSRTIFGLLRAIEFSNLQPLLSDFRLMAYWGESLYYYVNITLRVRSVNFFFGG